MRAGQTTAWMCLRSGRLEPGGVTNTFEMCEFKPDARWAYVMHDANGKDYPNESVFSEIPPAKQVVIQHVLQPRFLLTISLEPTGSGDTPVRWEQAFEGSRVASGIARIALPANEQNLDRLSAEVLSPKPLACGKNQ